MLSKRRITKVILYLLIIYFIATCVMFIGVFKHPSTTLTKIKRSRMTLRRSPSCLHMHPAMRHDEFLPAGDSEEVKKVCPGAYWLNLDRQSWDVNFNMARTFRFHPGEIEHIRNADKGENREQRNINTVAENTKKDGKAEHVEHPVVAEDANAAVMKENIKTDVSVENTNSDNLAENMNTEINKENTITDVLAENTNADVNKETTETDVLAENTNVDANKVNTKTDVPAEKTNAEGNKENTKTDVLAENANAESDVLADNTKTDVLAENTKTDVLTENTNTIAENAPSDVSKENTKTGVNAENTKVDTNTITNTIAENNRKDDNIVDKITDFIIEVTKNDVNADETEHDANAGNTETMSDLLDNINPFVISNIDREEETPAIPKVFHLIWTDEIIPSNFVDNLKLFREMHLTWKIHFWTLKAGRQFIENHEPKILDIYKSLPNVFKADVLRYVLIYHIGGAYFDLDSKVIRPIDELAENHGCLLGPEPIENAVTVLKRRSLLANSALLCKPEHPFFRHVIDSIHLEKTHEPGPRFLTFCFNKFLCKLLDSKRKSTEWLVFEITIAPHDYFEFYVNKGNNVDRSMGDLCKQYNMDAKQFFINCVNFPKHPGCSAMFKQVPRGKRMELEACIEWESHGRHKRGPSDDIYVLHKHFGTHQNDRIHTLEFKSENDISRILPGIDIHT